MTTLEKIRAEIYKKSVQMHFDGNFYIKMEEVLPIIDKYAEQEPNIDMECDEIKILQKRSYLEGFHEAHKMLVKQEPCDDVISREAVIDDFIEWREKLEYTVGEDYSGVHLLNVAIQKIWDMPSVTPKPTECEDAVSRQAVLDVIYGQHIGGKEAVEHGLRNTYAGDLREIADEIIAIPSVRPQEQTKEEHIDVFEVANVPWIFLDNCANSGYYCSKCKKKLVKDGWSETVKKINFCPNCGAKMVEQRETETWHGIHAQITAPKGTFEQIFNEADDDYDI